MAKTPELPSRAMTSRAFWQAVDRLQVADYDALGLIGYPGKIGPSGKRPPVPADNTPNPACALPARD